MEKLSLSEKGVLVILSSPSGAGKTSIARALVEENKNFLFIEDPFLNVLPTAKRAAFINNASYDYNNNIILTFFHLRKTVK